MIFQSNQRISSTTSPLFVKPLRRAGIRPGTRRVKALSVPTPTKLVTLDPRSKVFHDFEIIDHNGRPLATSISASKVLIFCRDDSG